MQWISDIYSLTFYFKAISDAVRTSLGPRGMDKMVRDERLPTLRALTLKYQIQTPKGEVIITNDGATILKCIQAMHPAAKMVRDCPPYGASN